MDGNGRWAQERGKRRVKGHEVGAESVRAITRECARLGVAELTLYAFSTENWRRPRTEVSLLMELLKRYLIQERDEIMQNRIVFRAIGQLDRLPGKVLREYERTRDMSAGNGGMSSRPAMPVSSPSPTTTAASATGAPCASTTTPATAPPSGPSSSRSSAVLPSRPCTKRHRDAV